MTRPYLALVLVVGGGATLAASCGNNSSHPPYSSPLATGGSSGRAGRGSGGTSGTSALAGEAGTTAGASGEGTGGHAGRRSTGGTGGTSDGTGGTLIIGGAGAPYTGDMSALAGSDGSGGAPGPGDAEGRLFIGPGGFDAATGTRDNPFGTLAGAVAKAKAGNTIVFLAGNYTLPGLDDAITIPDGVDIVADEPRLVVLSGAGDTLLDLAGDTSIDGIRFSGFATVVKATSDDGSVTVTNSVFDSCPPDGSTSVVEVGGGASVTLTGDATHDWGDCPAFGSVTGSGTLAFDGGQLHFTGDAEPALFSASLSGKLTLSNLIATDGNRPVVLLADSARATIASATLSTLGSDAIVLGGEASLDVTNTDVALGSASGADACIRSNVSGTSSLTLAHSLLHDCPAGILGTAPSTVSLTDTELYGLSASGLDLMGGIGTVHIDTSSFHDDGTRAVRFGGGSVQLTVRGTTVTTVPTGFELDGDASSSWDFGTLADPGGNTLTATTSSLVLGSSTSVTAVGNTWTPSVQGADSAGQYAATGPSSTLEVTSGSGQNYTDDYGATLRLAENP
jgi:hypothetical protein